MLQRYVLQPKPSICKSAMVRQNVMANRLADLMVFGLNTMFENDLSSDDTLQWYLLGGRHTRPKWQRDQHRKLYTLQDKYDLVERTIDFKFMALARSRQSFYCMLFQRMLVVSFLRIPTRDTGICCHGAVHFLISSVCCNFVELL